MERVSRGSAPAGLSTAGAGTERKHAAGVRLPAANLETPIGRQVLAPLVVATVMPHVAIRRLELPPRASRRLVQRWVGPAVAMAACAALILAFGSAYWDGYQLRRGAAGLARERDELRLQNAQLREEIRLLNTPEHIERLAREQLGLVRPGEIAVILVKPAPAPVLPAPAQPRREAEEPRPWWVRLLRR